MAKTVLAVAVGSQNTFELLCSMNRLEFGSANEGPPFAKHSSSILS